MRQGVLSNLGNPKMAIFFTSLLPQFAPQPASLGQGAVRTVLNWVVAAPFVGSALQENFVTFTAKVTDANGHQGVATSTFQLTHSAANGQELTPQPNH